MFHICFHNTVPYVSSGLNHVLIHAHEVTSQKSTCKKYVKRKRFHKTSVQPQMFSFRVLFSPCPVLDFLSVFCYCFQSVCVCLVSVLYFVVGLQAECASLDNSDCFFVTASALQNWFLSCNFSLFVCVLSIFLLIYVLLFLGLFCHPVIHTVPHKQKLSNMREVLPSFFPQVSHGFVCISDTKSSMLKICLCLLHQNKIMRIENTVLGKYS